MDDGVLDAGGLRLLDRLGASQLCRRFYLAGGTALALQLGHRRSYDLDLFTLRPSVRLPLAQLVREVLGLFGEAEARPVLQESGQSDWEIGGVRVSFIAYPFPLVYPLQPYRGVSLADPREIALMKAYALGRRATARDYVDLYWLLKSRVITLDEIIRHCGPKFVLDGHAVFDARLFLGQLAYTADVEARDAALRAVRGGSLTFAAVERFLREEVKRYGEQSLRGPHPG